MTMMMVAVAMAILMINNQATVRSMVLVVARVMHTMYCGSGNGAGGWN